MCARMYVCMHVYMCVYVCVYVVCVVVQTVYISVSSESQEIDLFHITL